MIGWCQYDYVVVVIVLIDIDNIEQVYGEGDQVGIVILFFNVFCQCLGFFVIVGVDFQQVVMILFQLCFQCFMLFAVVFDQIVKVFGLIW